MDLPAVLVIGATGYLGGPAAERLRETGHDVVALAHDDAAASRLERAGYRVRRGDLRSTDSLSAAVEGVDAVVHVGAPLGDPDAEHAAVDALQAGLAARGGRLVYTSGVWVLGSGGRRVLDEDAPIDAPAIVRWRPAVERQVLDGGGVVVRPGIAHGRGGGIPALLVQLAASHGAGRYVGDAAVRWPLVHVDDLADLFVLAVRRADPGSVLHGVDEPAVAAAALAAAADVAAGGAGRAEPWTVAEAAAVLGEPFAEVLALDQHVQGERARRELGWQPHRPDGLRDLLDGSYGARDSADAVGAGSR